MSTVTLRNYSSDAIKHLGTVVLPVIHRGKTLSVKYFVVTKRCAILGLAVCEDIDLLHHIADISTVASQVALGPATLQERVMKDYPKLVLRLEMR